MSYPEFKSADIFFVMHHENKMSRLIAWFMGSKWSHSGLVFEDAKLATYTIETSNYEVTHGDLRDYLESPTASIEVWRFEDLSSEQAVSIVRDADKLRGNLFGYFQLISLGIRRLLKRVHINVSNFIRSGQVCCHVVTYGFAGLKEKGLSSEDPEAIDTQDLYELVCRSNATKIYEKKGNQ